MLTSPLVADGWNDVKQHIPIRQKAFCNLMNEYERKAEDAQRSKNQIRQNKVKADRGQDLLALMPEGGFSNWLVEIIEVNVISSGDAVYDMRLQCGVSLGSGKIESGENYAATAKVGSTIYNQLAGVSSGDFVLISGKLITFNEINTSNGRLDFVSVIKGQSIQKYARFNERVKYFAQISALSKF